MIPKNTKNIKSFWKENKNDILLAISFFLIAIIAFGLGRLSVIMEEKEDFSVYIDKQGASVGSLEKAGERGSAYSDLPYVGSKNGAVYHLPRCPGAKRINEENKIWFSSVEEAENLGYRAAKNCDGI